MERYCYHGPVSPHWYKAGARPQQVTVSGAASGGHHEDTGQYLLSTQFTFAFWWELGYNQVIM